MVQNRGNYAAYVVQMKPLIKTVKRVLLMIRVTKLAGCESRNCTEGTATKGIILLQSLCYTVLRTAFAV